MRLDIEDMSYEVNGATLMHKVIEVFSCIIYFQVDSVASAKF